MSLLSGVCVCRVRGFCRDHQPFVTCQITHTYTQSIVSFHPWSRPCVCVCVCVWGERLGLGGPRQTIEPKLNQKVCNRRGLSSRHKKKKRRPSHRLTHHRLRRTHTHSLSLLKLFFGFVSSSTSPPPPCAFVWFCSSARASNGSGNEVRCGGTGAEYVHGVAVGALNGALQHKVVAAAASRAHQRPTSLQQAALPLLNPRVTSVL